MLLPILSLVHHFHYIWPVDYVPILGPINFILTTTDMTEMLGSNSGVFELQSLLES
jgi:hypothetical protein